MATKRSAAVPVKKDCPRLYCSNPSKSEGRTERCFIDSENASAQEIFAYLLAKVEHEFSYSVLPIIGKVDEAGINAIVTEKIVAPTISECG